MSDGSRRAAAGYLRFVAWTAGLTAVVLGLGFLPTRGLAGTGGPPAMLAGGMIGLAASWLGGIPTALAAARPPAARRAAIATVILGGMALRFVVVLALILAVALSSRLARGPLLVWAAISYVVLLAVDIRYTLTALGAAEDLER